MKRESFNSSWLFCYGSGTALERTVSGTQAVILAPLTYSDEELKIEVQ